MASVEERLEKVEREIELLREQRKAWPIAQVDEKFKGDEVLKEIFQLGKEDRERERRNCFTSIVTFHEVMNGWLKYIAAPKSQRAVVNAYARFEALLTAFSSSELLPFSEKAKRRARSQLRKSMKG